MHLKTGVPILRNREKRTKVAAGFQVFMTASFKAIIVQQVQIFQKIRKIYFHFQQT
jgi:hypothetical protein